MIPLLALAAITYIFWIVTTAFYFRRVKTTGNLPLRGLAICGILGIATDFTLLVTTASALVPWRLWPGSLLYALSIGLLAWSLHTAASARLHAAFERVPAERLLTSGPYAFIRHPIYTSYLSGWAAAPLATGNAWLLVIFAVMITFYIAAAKHEEAELAGSFSLVYENYRRRTGMFLPRLAR